MTLRDKGDTVGVVKQANLSIEWCQQEFGLTPVQKFKIRFGQNCGWFGTIGLVLYCYLLLYRLVYSV